MFSLLFQEEPEGIAKQAAIHGLSLPAVSVRTMLDLLERMGLSDRIDGLSWEKDRTWITASDNKVTVSCNELSGGLQYRLRPLADEPGTDVSDDETVERIARSFLDRIGRPAEPLHLERVTHLFSQSADTEEKTSTPSRLDAGVIFTRRIDELPVIGPGAVVKVGTDDVVVGGREVWRPIAKSGSKVPLRSPPEAMDMLERKLKRSGLDGKHFVCAAWQGYAESGIEEAQTELEPCYVFVIENYDDDFATKRIVIVPAARVGRMASSFTA